jgi:hypothetical protein
LNRLVALLYIIMISFCISRNRGLEMRREAMLILYAVLMAALIVAVDILLFRHRFWERLMANVGIVLVFGAFYLRFLK